MGEQKSNLFRGAKVLVLDDSPTILAIITRLGEMQGAQVVTTKDPTEVESLLQTHLPDFLILDQMVDDTTGLEIIKKLRAQEAFDDLPIVLLTASEEPELALEAIIAGADDFIEKTNFQKVLFPKMLSMVRLREKNKKLIQLKQLHAIHSVIATVKHEYGNLLFKLRGQLARLQKGHLEPASAEALSKALENVKEQAVILKKLNEVQEVNLTDYAPGIKMLKVK